MSTNDVEEIRAMNDAAPGAEPPATGARSLMQAVLLDAVRCLSGEVTPRRKRARLAAEARAWVMAGDRHWPFSFENVCDVLGFEVDALRSRLLRNAPEILAAPRGRREHVAAAGDVVRLIRAGQPLRVVAEQLGISVSKASSLSGGLASRMKAERDAEILRLRQAGWTERALAHRFGLSDIRIARICARADGGRRQPARTAA